MRWWNGKQRPNFILLWHLSKNCLQPSDSLTISWFALKAAPFLPSAWFHSTSTTRYTFPCTVCTRSAMSEQELASIVSIASSSFFWTPKVNILIAVWRTFQRKKDWGNPAYCRFPWCWDWFRAANDGYVQSVVPESIQKGSCLFRCGQRPKNISIRCLFWMQIIIFIALAGCKSHLYYMIYIPVCISCHDDIFN